MCNESFVTAVDTGVWGIPFNGFLSKTTQSQCKSHKQSPRAEGDQSVRNPTDMVCHKKDSVLFNINPHTHMCSLCIIGNSGSRHLCVDEHTHCLSLLMTVFVLLWLHGCRRRRRFAGWYLVSSVSCSICKPCLVCLCPLHIVCQDRDRCGGS